MFAFSGRVLSAERLKSNYLALVLRHERDGLLGDTIQVLVPTLVELRDGVPDVGAWAWVEALPAQSGDLALGVGGFDFVAFRVMGSPIEQGPADQAGAVDALFGGPLDRQRLFP